MVDLFLWPTLLCLLIPIGYSFLNDKKCIKEILLISFILLVIVILYWPFMVFFENIPYVGYLLGKLLLFVIFPFIMFYLYIKYINKKINIGQTLSEFGVQRAGIKDSMQYFLILLPIMLFANFIVGMGPDSPVQSWYSGMMFMESFTEEFFFRGILFLYLWKLLDIRIAYATSIIGFVLLHPQYFFEIGMLAGLVQGVLTCIISHKSKNIVGAWFLHGANRVFSLSIMPLF